MKDSKRLVVLDSRQVRHLAAKDLRHDLSSLRFVKLIGDLLLEEENGSILTNGSQPPVNQLSSQTDNQSMGQSVNQDIGKSVSSSASQSVNQSVN